MAAGANAASDSRRLIEDFSTNVSASMRESVLFIGTQFSILYTFMYSPA
jgi:hypothetical protein